MGIGFPKKIQFPIDQSCVGYWKFDEASGNIKDWSGNGNTGTAYNLTYSQQGKFGNSCSLNGITSYINCGNGSSLDITGAITIEIWVKSLENSATLFQGIVAKSNLNGAELGWLISKRIDNKFYFQTTPNYPRLDLTTYSNIAYTDNSWHHIVGVRQLDGTNFIYMDGTKQIASRTGSTIVSVNYPLVIGTGYSDLPLNNTYLQIFNGTIDDVRIYNRALSAQEIKRHYMVGR